MDGPEQHSILVLYYSHKGAVRALAQQIARGIESVGVNAVLRTVPAVSANCESIEPPVPDHGAPYVDEADIAQCIGLALGSPTRFGNMAAAMKYFWDGTILTWKNGTLVGKPATVFTSSGSQHGGNESTLLSMMLPLMHHGMLLVGLSYMEPDLLAETNIAHGGSPYGATHISGAQGDPKLSDVEATLAFAQGKRLAEIALKLID